LRKNQKGSALDWRVSQRTVVSVFGGLGKWAEAVFPAWTFCRGRTHHLSGSCLAFVTLRLRHFARYVTSG